MPRGIQDPLSHNRSPLCYSQQLLQDASSYFSPRLLAWSAGSYKTIRSCATTEGDCRILAHRPNPAIDCGLNLGPIRIPVLRRLRMVGADGQPRVAVAIDLLPI